MLGAVVIGVVCACSLFLYGHIRSDYALTAVVTALCAVAVVLVGLRRSAFLDGPISDAGVSSVPSVPPDSAGIEQAEAALHRSEVLQSTLLQTIPLPVYYKDMHGRYLGCNAAFCAFVGRTEQDVVGQTAYEVWPQEMARLYCTKDEELLHNPQGVQTFDSLIARGDGALREVMFHKASMRDAHGQLLGIVGVFHDITERKQAEQKMRHLAFYDPLTQLPNRRMLLERLQQGLNHSACSGTYGAVLFLDIDKFKLLNDTYGHDMGDLLLIFVARRLESCVRHGDTVARFGGDEYVVLLELLDTQRHHAHMQAQAVAEKVRVALYEPYQLHDLSYQCSTSIGVALFQGSAVGPDELLKQADAAMYQAKQSGRNAIRFYAPAPHQGCSESN